MYLTRRSNPPTRNRVTRNRSDFEKIARCGTFSNETPKNFKAKVPHRAKRSIELRLGKSAKSEHPQSGDPQSLGL
jgi:uncharacterized protein (DUF2225 family)